MLTIVSWPEDRAELEALQCELARSDLPPWQPCQSEGPMAVGGVFVCFPRGGTGAGRRGDPAWAAAALVRGQTVIATAIAAGRAAGPYVPGLLAWREGPLLEAAVRALPARPQVLLVNATGRDHPRGGGLALHLGAVLNLPTIGVTHRPLVASGPWPRAERGARTPLVLERAAVGCWLRTRSRARPLVVHPGWRTDLETAVTVVLEVTGEARSPFPLRAARRAAREARARGQGYALETGIP